MIYLEFFILAALIIYFSVKLTKEAEVIQNNTKINVALIGILIAFATSLPELATGLTAAFIGQSQMALANIIGSNIFNTTMVAFVNIYFFKEIVYHRVKGETNKINYFVFAMYLSIIAVLVITKVNFFIFGFINLCTIALLIIYFLSIRYIKNEDKNSNGSTGMVNETKNEKFNLKPTIFKFAIFATIILISSILLAFVADRIEQSTYLNASFVGAIFIGITSALPEFTTLFTLIKQKQYNLGVSTVLSSNLFNFLILAIIDIVSKEQVFLATKGDGILLLLGVGITGIVLTALAIKFSFKNKYANLIFPFLIIGIYVLYVFSGVAS